MSTLVFFRNWDVERQPVFANTQCCNKAWEWGVDLGLDRRSVGLVEGALCRWSAEFVMGVLEVEADEKKI